MTRTADHGFTLIESLVALAVLAMSAIALLGATEAHVARIGGLEQRAAAGWAAENHLAELSLGLAAAADPDPILNHPVHLTTRASATADPDLTRIDITASIGGNGAPVTRLTGFVLARAADKGVAP
jgi:general secretion pathway protein I